MEKDLRFLVEFIFLLVLHCSLLAVGWRLPMVSYYVTISIYSFKTWELIIWTSAMEGFSMCFARMDFYDMSHNHESDSIAFAIIYG